jgi:uncharacterized protein (TIGR00369 family)
MAASALSIQQIENLLSREFPQGYNADSGLSIEHVEFGAAQVRRKFNPNSLRPGGTISGPTMMALADFALYVAVFSAVGPEPLVVTANLNINFLRKPARADLLAKARLLKLGKRLAVGEVTICSEGSDSPVAHVTATYSIPVKAG